MRGPLRQRKLLTQTALQCLNHSIPPPKSGPAYLQRRNLFESVFGTKSKKKSSAASAQNPFLEDVLSRKTSQKKAAPQKGDLSASSVFSTTEDVKPADEEDDRGRYRRNFKEETTIDGRKRDLHTIGVVMDPDPRARELWQRRMVIRSVRRKERLNREQFVKKTEREIVVRSHDFKTSVKKLGALARQIQGKSVEDALVQMRFSKKKVATDVKEHLEFARDKAIVSRGMGLSNAAPAEQQGAEQAPQAPEPIEIQLKDGKRYKVTDASQIYVDQAWVGRGPFGKLPDYRARGQMNIMRPPQTHLSLKLKEQSTLIREWEEREQKRRRQRLDKVWVPLPDRPLHGQHQYYTW